MKRILCAISLCMVFSAFASSNKVVTKKVTVLNHDLKAGYYVAFKYEDDIGSIARDAVNVTAALKMPNPPGSSAQPRIMWGGQSVKGKGKLVYIGIYPAGTTRPSMFYASNYTEPIYDHTVTPDKDEITFNIYGPQPDGSFEVKW